ncbi:Avirulence (Avh) protein [Phytophthora megakarya]|uniref:RxLR effector protein n=1 Tax=Phytophthora megakarya TaxID=4795 RepID=A0A225VXI6_9STRA|nr:Avirulence (Avh) protein [Phytophthora megakarya]
MRLSQVFAAIAASFLFTSQAFSANMDNNQAKIATVASPGISNQRLLRAHHRVEEEVGTEERNYWNKFSATDQQRLIKKAEKIGFNLLESFKKPSIFNALSKAQQQSYFDKLNKIKKAYKSQKPPMINYG